MGNILGCFFFLRAIWHVDHAPAITAHRLITRGRTPSLNTRRVLPNYDRGSESAKVRSVTDYFRPSTAAGRQGHRLHTIAMLIYENLWSARWIRKANDADKNDVVVRTDECLS